MSESDAKPGESSDTLRRNMAGSEDIIDADGRDE
jgi:hypothetical protein